MKTVTVQPLTRGGICDIIRIERSVPVIYPEWLQPLYPELEAVGPPEFSLCSLQRWIHRDQENGLVTGNFLHEHLRDNGMLEDCLGFAELLEIQKLDTEVFRRHFSGNSVYGWRSVVRNNNLNNLYVPHLFAGRVVVYWRWAWLDAELNARCTALRFGK